MLTGFLSFLGVVIGASLQYFFTRHIESQRHVRDLRSKAYMDYLKCVCEQAQFRPKIGTQEQKELFSRTGDAKARICLYGSKQAVSAFSSFEELGAGMVSKEQREAFTAMVSIMRTDSGSEVCVNNSELQNVLLGIHD
ncbi:MAG: hypothetical protein COA71_01815 [SAR86 cluster bacterium]|uniref:Uncharacterized protein n=1 Tax=SAR86 cluster bacterium TaxID=2030880 RepID=A0A2A5CID0_9GAMM|nr:MAG: hypothetical protein COA71_01815 [SAR86 cluster bacterium]